MSRLRLLIISSIVVTLLAVIPHGLAGHLSFIEATEIPSSAMTRVLSWEWVNEWFYVFNELSIVYLIVPFFLLELIVYGVRKKLSKTVMLDAVTNVITVFAFTAIEYLLGGLFLMKVYFLVYEHLSLPHLPLNAITIISCILLADFAYYWDHRMMHRIGAGWATHTVHHSSPFFNLSVAYRFGPLDAVFPILFSLPLVVLGFDPLLVLLCEVFVQTFQAILHTEIIGRLPRPIEYLFNTPSHHRVHHGSNRQYWDKNYAGILIIWDRMLGTFEPEKEKVVYGISEPLNSVNPIQVFFHGLYRLAYKLQQTKGWKNKLKVLVLPPDWEPRRKKE